MCGGDLPVVCTCGRSADRSGGGLSDGSDGQV